jgi:hypothetical protein
MVGSSAKQATSAYEPDRQPEIGGHGIGQRGQLREGGRDELGA